MFIRIRRDLKTVSISFRRGTSTTCLILIYKVWRPQTKLFYTFSRIVMYYWVFRNHPLFQSRASVSDPLQGPYSENVFTIHRCGWLCSRTSEISSIPVATTYDSLLAGDIKNKMCFLFFQKHVGMSGARAPPKTVYQSSRTCENFYPCHSIQGTYSTKSLPC